MTVIYAFWCSDGDTNEGEQIWCGSNDGSTDSRCQNIVNFTRKHQLGVDVEEDDLDLLETHQIWEEEINGREIERSIRSDGFQRRPEKNRCRGGVRRQQR